MIWEEWKVGRNNVSSAAALSAKRWMDVTAARSRAARMAWWSAATSPASSALNEVACPVANEREWKVVP